MADEKTTPKKEPKKATRFKITKPNKNIIYRNRLNAEEIKRHKSIGNKVEEV